MARRPTVGLRKAVSDFYFEQLDSLDRAGGKRCPGEEPCSRPPVDEATGEKNPDSFLLYGELAKRTGRTVEEVCGECPRKATKPGQHSPHLTNALALAAELDELRDAGASFPYPSASTSPYWWTCLKASKDGRRRADEAKRKRDKEKEEADARRRAVENQRGGRRG